MSWLYLFAGDGLEITSYCITENEMSNEDKVMATLYVSDNVDVSGLKLYLSFGSNSRCVWCKIDETKDTNSIFVVKGEGNFKFCTQNVKEAWSYTIHHGGIHKAVELSLDKLIRLDLEQIQKARVMVLFIKQDTKKLLGYTYDIDRMYEYIDTFQKYEGYIATPIILQRFDGEDIYYDSNNSNLFEFTRSPEANKVKLELENELTPSHLARYKLLR